MCPSDMSNNQSACVKVPAQANSHVSELNKSCIFIVLTPNVKKI